MSIHWNLFRAAIAVGLAAIGMGCGGINASQSVSPATFLLPGLGQIDSQKPPLDAPKDPQVAAFTVVVAE